MRILLDRKLKKAWKAMATSSAFHLIQDDVSSRVSMGFKVNLEELV